MNLENPTIGETIREFYDQHIGSYWLQAIGVGRVDDKPAIYVYTKRRQIPPRIRQLTELRGFPLVWRYSGEIKIGS